MRSVNLDRDISDPASSLGYLLTSVAKDALERILSSIRPNSTQRAWRVAGDYGAGKTAFGLVLARIAKGDKDELPHDLRHFVGPHRLLPAVASGDNEPLGLTVLRALGRKPHSGKRSRPSTAEVLEAVHDARISARQRHFSGLLLILDELGKNLEHAAQHPEFDDVFLLQELAEEAARSGGEPLVVVVLLHQGVAAYTAGLDSTARREWDKVAGRFEEIVYAHPLEQVASLVAATLNVMVKAVPQSIQEESEAAMAAALRSGLYGAAAAASLTGLGPKLIPLHPTVLPVLVRAMRRFGQNERSLFSFISTAEPMGLQQHCSRSFSEVGHYRIHHLFDYVRSNLLPSVITGTAHTHWGVIEAVLSSTELETPVEEAVLKTVAMLSLLDAPDLSATEDAVILAVGSASTRKGTEKAIKSLHNRGIIYERGSVRGLCLWPHTSVDLDEAYSNATLATAVAGDGVSLLCEQIRSERLVPRAYYVKTGTLRYAEVRLLPATALRTLLTNQPHLDGCEPDLNLWVLVPLDKHQQHDAKRLLSEQHSSLVEGLIVAVAEAPGQAIAALGDLIAWEWVKKNTPQLSGDRYAREEVTRQIGHAERALRTRLGGLNNLAVPGYHPLTFFHHKGTTPLAPGRELLAFLGNECARIYRKTPRVLNELINRRAPSSAAVAARTKLLEAMASGSHQENLGMDNTKRPAEMALYLSILKTGGFHVENGSGGWVFRTPDRDADTYRLLPSLDLITKTLQAQGTDALVPVLRVFEALSHPPFGIREGLQPFILAIYLATQHQRIALYEDGTYLPQVGGEAFLRLMKEPQAFHLQYCALEGVRAEVFGKLLELMQVEPRDAAETDLIDFVRPLFVFISREVPDYCRQTNNLPATAVAVRRALLHAREPVKLVFTTLPQACGLLPVGSDRSGSPDELALRLRTALHDIRSAYTKLIERLGFAICAAFDVATGWPAGRSMVAKRATQLATTVTDPSLRAFVLRLADDALADRAWIESVANLLARKSPERWNDIDETEFSHQLQVSAERFKRTELALLGAGRKLNSSACHISLTKGDGSEVSDFVSWDGLDENRIRPLEADFENLLAHNGRHGIAAAMRAIWNQLRADKEPTKE
ncbi:MAG: hypothetical protein WCK89_03945 [bacterium]